MAIIAVLPSMEMYFPVSVVESCYFLYEVVFSLCDLAMKHKKYTSNTRGNCSYKTTTLLPALGLPVHCCDKRTGF